MQFYLQDPLSPSRKRREGLRGTHLGDKVKYFYEFKQFLKKTMEPVFVEGRIIVENWYYFSDMAGLLKLNFQTLPSWKK